MIIKLNGRNGQPTFVKLVSQVTGGACEKMTSMTSTVKDKFKRRNIKPLAERNRTTVGLVGIAIVVALVVAVFSYEKIPFLTGKSGYSAYFTEAGGIKPDSDVRVSGLSVGRVSSVKLDGTKVLVKFTSMTTSHWATAPKRRSRPRRARHEDARDNSAWRRRAAGPDRGGAHSRAYDLPDALGDLTSTISALDTAKLSSALTTLANTFKDTHLI